MDEYVISGIEPIKIEDEIKRSFLSYSMSVIVARALPDVRDGLKPVHRRILYAMNELGLDPGKGYKKCARIVGETMGKYHPHGESSIYDALVRMAQDFSIRYTLVDGHGNFGSVDGDAPAAQRYTEAKLARISAEMLRDIEKETVDFVPNYDEEDEEPTVLPARFPNLLVNGSVGIAVGMATNIPPHNLREVIDGLLKIIDNHVEEGRDTDVTELLPIIKGPDFPTAATILGTAGIRAAYRTGRGKILVRAQAEIEPMHGGREMIVVTEIPYQVNKAKLIERIADLVKEKKVEGISDLRDESNREGMRIVVELKKDANANVVLNNLYKYSSLQESFGIIMLALSGNQPRLFNLKEMLTHYLDHQKDVITRRTVFDLNKAITREHIVQGFIMALDHIDEIIAIIRANREIARSKEIIMERFGFTKEQADAIVEMRLRSLSGLEREKLESELAALIALIAECRAIISDENKLYTVIRKELSDIRNKYGDERRTRIVPYDGEISDEDLIDEDMCVITLSQYDYIKRMPLSEYKSQNRGGKGIIGVTMRDEDDVKRLFLAGTHDYVLFFTNQGKVYRCKAYEIAEAGRTAKGTALVNLLSLATDEKIAAAIPVASKGEGAGGYLVMVSRNGIVKKTRLEQYGRIPGRGLIALNIREGDELINVLHTNGDSDIIIATKNGMGMRFAEDSVRAVGRNASGVIGIRLRDGDRVIGAVTVMPDDGQKLLVASSGGYGKCTDISGMNAKGRGGLGVKIYKTTEKTGDLVGLCMVNDNQELMLINSQGVIIRIRVADISTTGRVASGVKLINIEPGVSVISIARIEEEYVGLDEDTEEAVAEGEEEDDK